MLKMVLFSPLEKVFHGIEPVMQLFACSEKSFRLLIQKGVGWYVKQIQKGG